MAVLPTEAQDFVGWNTACAIVWGADENDGRVDLSELLPSFLALSWRPGRGRQLSIYPQRSNFFKGQSSGMWTLYLMWSCELWLSFARDFRWDGGVAGKSFWVWSIDAHSTFLASTALYNNICHRANGMHTAINVYASSYNTCYDELRCGLFQQKGSDDGGFLSPIKLLFFPCQTNFHVPLFPWVWH